MKRKIIIVLGIIFLFLSVGIQPAIATVELDTEIDNESKNYLFQTIIEIANNPEVMDLLERYDDNLFKFDIDRSINRKLLLRNPKLIINILFTKPSISVEYLNKCYIQGSEAIKNIGRDKLIEMIESIEISKPTVFDKLINSIMRNKELSKRITALRVLNKDSLICDILMLIGYPIGWLFTLMTIFIGRNEGNPIRYTIFRIIGIPINSMMVCMVLLLKYLHCLDFPP